MATLSTSSVERLTDLILEVKRELKADIARVEGKVDRVEGKLDEVLRILQGGNPDISGPRRIGGREHGPPLSR